ncbi:MAG: hypothetical protein ABI305_08420, partial [Tepidiformaceae bacterium]
MPIFDEPVLSLAETSIEGQSLELYRFLRRVATTSTVVATAVNLMLLAEPLARDFGRLSLDPNQREVAEFLAGVQMNRLAQVGMPSVLRTLHEITLCRTVDCFDDYLDMIATRWWKCRPTEMVDPEAFSRKPLEQRLEHIERACGAGLDKASENYRRFHEYIQVRHLIDHSGGRVTRKFLDRTGRPDLAAGQLFPLEEGYATSNGPQFVQFVKAMDRAIVVQLGFEPVTVQQLDELSTS